MRGQRNLARVRARGAKKRVESAQRCSESRLKREVAAEGTSVKELRVEVDELHAHVKELIPAQSSELSAAAEAQERVHSMTVLHKQRVAGTGVGGPFLLFHVRALLYGQLARFTPPRAIGPNINATLRCVAPELRFGEPTYDAVCKMRGEMSIVGEMFAAR
eukprot:2516530-Pleurochrysis_carterae.AAC.2